MLPAKINVSSLEFTVVRIAKFGQVTIDCLLAHRDHAVDLLFGVIDALFDVKEISSNVDLDEVSGGCDHC